MNPLLLKAEVQAYLLQQLQRTPEQIALEKSPFEGISSSELAAQLDGRKRSRAKLPTWYDTVGVYFPKRLNLEQSSSEATADYKAALLPEGGRVLDLTGGFGVDSFAFAKRADEVTYVERDAELTKIVRHNAEALGIIGLDVHHTDGITFLRNSEPGKYDLIYLDPARRLGSKKTYRLEDSEPNVLEILPELLATAPWIMLKLAPMLDIQEAVRPLKHLHEIHIISVDGECKELLCLLRAPVTATVISPTASQERHRPEMVISTLRGPHWQTARFPYGAEERSTSRIGPPKKYLYEPDAAWLKSGAFKYIGQHDDLEKIHQHTHLYTSERLVPDFMGKTTEVVEILPYSSFKKLKKGTTATVITRHFPLKPEELRRRHRIGENPDLHLYFCTGPDDQLLVIRSRRI